MVTDARFSRPLWSAHPRAPRCLGSGMPACVQSHLPVRPPPRLPPRTTSMTPLRCASAFEVLPHVFVRLAAQHHPRSMMMIYVLQDAAQLAALTLRVAALSLTGAHGSIHRGALCRRVHVSICSLPGIETGRRCRRTELGVAFQFFMYQCSRWRRPQGCPLVRGLECRMWPCLGPPSPLPRRQPVNLRKGGPRKAPPALRRVLSR